MANGGGGGGAPYTRHKQGGALTFEVAILQLSNTREALKVVQTVHDIVG